MWILENEGQAFEGKRLWLRPGKRYLFGRTVAEPGQLAIKGDASKSVSRKHCTIQVDTVPEGDGEDASKRSRVTIEDLGSKCGTRVNDTKIKKSTYVLSADTNVLQMGNFQAKFRISWHPVVLSYSFTAKELRADPLTKLRQSLEQLDVKYLGEYDTRYTTHIVTKKRNTPKGLQALINGRFIVNDGFVNALVAAALPEQADGGVETSLLEQDFDSNWPDALKYLPAANDEPVPRSTEAFAPNPDRGDIFDGYTFIFYEKKQWETLLGPITTGKGKALFREVNPGETENDDFIRYVKGIAGEKGLGEFEDGSEGKGVVVVRWIPKTDENLQWYSDFYTSISLRLDHRLIDQKDFLDAILGNDASVLRRPLETETSQANDPPATANPEVVMDVDEPEPDPSSRPSSRRTRNRAPPKSRFKGFAIDISEDEEPPKPAAPAAVEAPPDSQEGLFVSQEDPPPAELDDAPQAGRRSQRKRPAAARTSRDVMDDFAPTAAQVKRRRIEAGEDPVPRQPSPMPKTEPQETNLSAVKSPKAKKELDVLDMARRHREEAEARAKAEREELATAPDDLDLAEIRRLHIEEPMELRKAPPAMRSRDQEIAEGRWNPAWNGRPNFKNFKARGAPTRQLQKIIVPLQEVQTKAFGIGDDYWLEDESQQRGKGGRKKQTQSQSQSQGLSESQGRTNAAHQTRRPSPKLVENVPPPVDSDEDVHDGGGAGGSAFTGAMDEDDDDEEEEEEDVVITKPSSRSTRTSSRSQSQRTGPAAITQSSNATSQRRKTPSASASTTTTTSTTQRSSKRAAPAQPPARQQPAKRAKVVAIPASDEDDDSEDELRFRFGRR